MNPTTFTNAIIKTFDKEGFDLEGSQLIDESIANDLSRDIYIENAQMVFERLRDILHNALNQVRADTINLADLRRLRIQFYEARDQFFLLEEKEAADVQEMERDTKWHERSKLVRVFVSSEKGELLEQERKEAKLASAIATRFAQHLKDLEEAIDQHILFTADKNIPAFQQTVSLWRELGNLQKSAYLAKDNINNAYNDFRQTGCSNCGTPINWSIERSGNYLKIANKNLSDQLRILSPWHDRLTKEVETAVDRVRKQLMIPLV